MQVFFLFKVEQDLPGAFFSPEKHLHTALDSGWINTAADTGSLQVHANFIYTVKCHIPI